MARDNVGGCGGSLCRRDVDFADVGGAMTGNKWLQESWTPRIILLGALLTAIYLLMESYDWHLVKQAIWRWLE